MGFTFSENDTAKKGRATLQNLGSCKTIDSSRNMRMFCLSPPSRPSIYSYSVLLAVILH